MREPFPEAMVTGYENLIPSMTNHPKDRHVLAKTLVPLLSGTRGVSCRIRALQRQTPGLKPVEQ